ncbi:MAG TPA: TIR domain-containing protein [Methylomirabilota bacterium]|nr:TIR domain-containing protein [Methylomirabilota bacterium]
MTKPRAFISFDFDHNEREKNLFVGQGKLPDTPWEIADWSSKEALAQSRWEEIIKDKINRCNMLIVLVGRNMASATGVAKEIKMAKEQDVPLFGVYVDGANTQSTLPAGLARNRTITWTWPNIASAVDQMMNEGKNKSIKSFF